MMLFNVKMKLSLLIFTLPIFTLIFIVLILSFKNTKDFQLRFNQHWKYHLRLKIEKKEKKKWSNDVQNKHFLLPWSVSSSNFSTSPLQQFWLLSLVSLLYQKSDFSTQNSHSIHQIVCSLLLHIFLCVIVCMFRFEILL
jgi:hypothetical protein